MSAPLQMWTVYDHPLDYPDFFVARRFEVTADGAMPTSIALHSEDLEELREALMSQGFTPLARDPMDDPKIVETWL